MLVSQVMEGKLYFEKQEMLQYVTNAPPPPPPPRPPQRSPIMTLITAKEPESCTGRNLSFCFTFLCDI